MHIPLRENKKLTGTARFASVATHLGQEQSRRDDLECLGYSVLYLMTGQLPWQGIHADNRHDKYEKIKDMKATIPLDKLFKDLPIEFMKFMHYSRAIKFEDKPDYVALKKMFKDLYYFKQFDKNFCFDWNILKINYNITKGTSWTIDETNIADCPERILILAQNSKHEVVISDLSTPRTVQSIHPTTSQHSTTQVKTNQPEQQKNKIIQSSNNGEEEKPRTFRAQDIEEEKEIPKNEEKKIEKPLIITTLPESTSCDFKEEDIIEDKSIFGTILINFNR